MSSNTPKHILIAEGDAFLADIYQKKFEMEGFKVSKVSNVEKALIDIKKKHPDVVLLDVLLSKMDGLAVLDAVKSDRVLKKIPIILLTNLGQPDDVKRGLEKGAADYLIKTHFKLSEVVDKVKQVFHP